MGRIFGKILKKYLPALLVAAVIIVVTHSFFFTVYTYKAGTEEKRYLIKRTQNPVYGSLCLYRISGGLYLGRVAGISGDSLKIENSVIFRNGQPENLDYIKLTYRKLDFHKPDSLMFGDTLLAVDSAGLFSEDSLMLNRLQLPVKRKYPLFFFAKAEIGRNADYMSSILVPGIHTKISNTKYHRLLYGNIARKSDNSLRFGNNYFFMVNDNRDNLADSRHFGFIRADNIIGTIIWSFSDDRLF